LKTFLISFIIGVLGIKVKIMLPWDPNNKNGPKRPLPDNVSILEPKDETHIAEELKATKMSDIAAVPPTQAVA
jgi:small subunit ribosomal protein S3e